jgi:hypothetical protein
MNSDIAQIIDLDHITLGDIIRANTSITQLQANVFFVPTPGDFNGDGLVDTADYIVWRKTLGTNNVWADANGNGTVGPEDLDIWRAHYGANMAQGAGANLAQVPEPTSVCLLFLTLTLVHASRQQVPLFYGSRAKDPRTGLKYYLLSYPP